MEIGIDPNDDATKEAKQLSKGLSAEEIAKKTAEAEHDRNENFRNHFEKIAVAALWLFAVSFFLLVLTWLAHIVLPLKCHWLQPDQISKVQNLVTGGVVASVAIGHLRRRLGHQPE